MLKDFIRRNIEVINERRSQGELYPYKYKGVLEIVAYRGGKVFHCDKGDVNA